MVTAAQSMKTSIAVFSCTALEQQAATDTPAPS